ncbi:MAG: hypothetical protein GXP22_05395 [Gammaproteobacteria bacterium]|nr:hypothetical protein [Gammaproteobacteria bacterium]
MNTMKSISYKLSATAISLGLLFTMNVNAGTNPPVIDEYFDGFSGEFVVHTDYDQIYGFAVANDTAIDSFIFIPPSNTILTGWQTAIVSDVDWDAGFLFDDGFGSSITSWETPDTSLLPFSSWSDGASQAIVYWAGDGIKPLSPYSSTGGFMFEAGFSASPFLVFGDGFVPGGEVTNEISSVPLPAAVWLFGSALIGLFGFVRRR